MSGWAAWDAVEQSAGLKFVKTPLVAWSGPIKGSLVWFGGHRGFWFWGLRGYSWLSAPKLVLAGWEDHMGFQGSNSDQDCALALALASVFSF